MNETVTLSQIIARLAKITGTSPLTARSFLKVFFATIEKELIAGEPVTVKGIGTFRRTDGPLAPSPVAFIPDPEVAEEINQPFSMFEAVELDDDISEEELSAVDTPVVPEGIVSEKGPVRQEEEKPEEVIVHAPEASAGEEILPAGEIAEDVEESDEEPVMEPSIEKAFSENIESEPVDEPVTDPVVTAGDTSVDENREAQPEPEISAHVEEVYQHVAPEGSFAARIYAGEEEKPASMPFYVWIILGFAVGLALGYFLGFSIGSRQRAVSGDMDILTTIVFPDTIVAGTTVAPEPVVEPVPVEENAVPEVAGTEKVVEKVPEQEKPVYDTVTRTRYLATMAREHYGAMEYWVFIYMANEDALGNPDKIRPGTKVEIPPFSRYAQGSPSDPANIERARSMSKEIYSRFRKK